VCVRARARDRSERKWAGKRKTPLPEHIVSLFDDAFLAHPAHQPLLRRVSLVVAMHADAVRVCSGVGVVGVVLCRVVLCEFSGAACLLVYRDSAWRLVSQGSALCPSPVLCQRCCLFLKDSPSVLVQLGSCGSCALCASAQATEPAIEWATQEGKAVVAVPCCVFPTLFPQRLSADGLPVVTFEHHKFLALAPARSRCLARSDRRASAEGAEDAEGAGDARA